MKKNGIKNFICGLLSGAFIMFIANFNNIIRLSKDKTSGNSQKSIVTEIDFEDKFPEPNFIESPVATKEVAQYIIKDDYGSEIVIQGNNIVTYSFNEKDGWTAKEEPKVKVPVEIHEKLMCLYPSDKEKSIYNVLANKDRIKNQFYIYLTFEWMEAAYKELLYNEKKYEKELKKVEYNNIPDRKEFIYKVGYDYIILDKDYTMGGYKFSELQPAIQKDILKVFKRITYMYENGSVKEESEIEKFLDYQGKVLKYKIFRIGG